MCPWRPASHTHTFLECTRCTIALICPHCWQYRRCASYIMYIVNNTGSKCSVLFIDCWLWHVSWHGWRPLLQIQRRYDSCQVDSSRVCFVQEVHHKEWCVELWDGDVRDMVTGTQAIWRLWDKFSEKPYQIDITYGIEPIMCIYVITCGTVPLCLYDTNSTPCFSVSPKDIHSLSSLYMFYIDSHLCGGSHIGSPYWHSLFARHSFLRHALERLIKSRIFSSLAVWKPHCWHT